MGRLITYTILLFAILIVLFADGIGGRFLNIWVVCVLDIIAILFSIFVVMSIKRTFEMARLNKPNSGVIELIECGEFDRSANELFNSMKYWSIKEKIKFLFGLCGD